MKFKTKWSVKKFSKVNIMKDVETLGLDETLKILEDNIKRISDKVKSGRVKDIKKDEIRIKWIRTLAYICKIYAKIQESKKVVELEAKIDQIEQDLKLME